MRSCIYGPVPSWRLGRSLGIDLIQPPKTCPFDCVYCQLGKTINKVLQFEDLNSIINKEKVVNDLKDVLNRIEIASIDTITFSGSGEPTLNPQLGEMIETIRKMGYKIPIAVLTNASLVYKSDVRRNLAKADIVVAKLDAPDQKLFESINRPVEGLQIENVVNGLLKLRSEIEGKLAIQTMIFDSSLYEIKTNNDIQAVENLIEIIERIRPDEVQINTPVRPPSESFVIPLEEKKLSIIADKFRNSLLAKIVARGEIGVSPMVSWKTHKPLDIEILDILERRPCRIDDISRSLGISGKEAEEYIDKLLNLGKISSIRIRGQKFYTKHTTHT